MPCVGGDGTAGNRDHPSRGRPGPACQLFACPPEKDGCKRGQSQHKESDGKEGEGDQKFMYEVKIKIESYDRGDQSTGSFENVRSAHGVPLGRWPYLGVCKDIAGATVAFGVADLN
jgi:hypothetical protein